MFLRLFFVLPTLLGFPVDITKPPLCNFVSPTGVKTGTTVPICIFIMSGPVGDPTAATYVPPQIKSIAFGVPLDQYAMLDLSGSFSGFNHPTRDQDRLYAWATGAPTSTGWARECALDPDIKPTFRGIESTTAYSCPQLYMTIDHVVPLASLVAVVNNGTLENLIWDNQCQTCPTLSDECIGGRLALTLANSTTTQQYLTENDYSKETDNKICSVPHTSCQPANKTGINCDFRVLLTWEGTDVKGKRLTSSSLRLTQFGGTSVGSMWNSVANSFNPNEGINSGNSENVL